MEELSFEDIRPFRDDEISKILPRLMQSNELQPFLKEFIHPVFGDQFHSAISEIDSLYSFQQKIIYPFLRHILKQSANNVSFSGIEELKSETGHLFMSNHRDIVLDSALINKGLFEAGHNTVEIAIGDNLVNEPWIKELVRMNKSFLVKRGLQPSEMLSASKQLSHYIRQSVHQRNQSVWIAQREGRAKDGDDQTNPGLLKMLNLSSESDPLSAFLELNIIPVSISYEYDPCDQMKIPELISESYQKKSGEDELSMKTGIFGPKGNIHVAFGSPINEHLVQYGSNLNRKELITLVVDEINKQVHNYYKIWPTNYAAYDLLHQQEAYSKYYSKNVAEELLKRVKSCADKLQISESEILPIYMGMYAKPLENQMALQKQKLTL